jgi:predicted membrane GTPase involved in stress response
MRVDGHDWPLIYCNFYMRVQPVNCADSSLVDDQNRRQQRLALIDAVKAQGRSLFSAATEDTLQTRIQLALLDLDHAVNWLTQDVIELDPELLRLVETTIDFATRNMAFVANALDDLRSSRTGGSRRM